MLLFSFLVCVFSTLTLVTATPIKPSTTTDSTERLSTHHASTPSLLTLAIERRKENSEGKPGSFHMCTEKQWRGECATVNLKMPECWNIRKPFRGNVKSIGPNEWLGNAAFQYDCIVYNEPACMGNGELVKWPGSVDLGISAWSVRCDYSNLDEYNRLKATPLGRLLILHNKGQGGD